jgi:hypothetical protein
MSTERSTSNILLPLRAVQILFAIILLGLTGYRTFLLPSSLSTLIPNTPFAKARSKR